MRQNLALPDEYCAHVFACSDMMTAVFLGNESMHNLSLQFNGTLNLICVIHDFSLRMAFRVL